MDSDCITFSASLKWSVVIKTLAQLANKAIMIIRNIQHLCGNIPVNVYFNLFDKMILPIMLYSAEVWGYTIRPDIEKVHINFVNIFLVFLKIHQAVLF